MEPTRKTKPKAKGNAFENKIAKKLGGWIFGDERMLCRHQTSGAQKHTYVGDIVPLKPVPPKWNSGVWPLLIECKNGYRNSVPTLNKQTLVRTWLTKALDESTPQQNIIYLITAFHGYSPLLFTDVPFTKLHSDLILNLTYNKRVIPFFIYSFNDIIEYDFDKLYSNSNELGQRLERSRTEFARINRKLNKRAI